MSILIVLTVLALAAVIAAVRTVVRDGYRRVPARATHVEAAWPRR